MGLNNAPFQASSEDLSKGLSKEQLQCNANIRAGLERHFLSCMAAGPLRMGGDRGFYKLGVVWDPVAVKATLGAHRDFRSWAFFQNHGPTAEASWRENVGSAAMQITLHFGALDERFVGWFLEIDYDEANPAWDLWSALRHGAGVFWHWVRGHKTNPFLVRAALEERGLYVPLVG
jgi:hypothetical protein